MVQPRRGDQVEESIVADKTRKTAEPIHPEQQPPTEKQVEPKPLDPSETALEADSPRADMETFHNAEPVAEG